MSLNDSSFINFDGSSVTGRVPARLRVMTGIEMTSEQHAGVKRLYQLFRDSIRVSPIPNGYHAKSWKLSDGTMVRMTSMQGKDLVQVWPAEDVIVDGLFRGFVIAPIAVTGYTLLAKLNTCILTAINNLGNWVPMIYRYRPGVTNTALKYRVMAQKWTGRTALDITLPGFVLWAGKALRNIFPLSDAKYNDVFCVEEKSLYLNAVRIKGFDATPPPGVPVVWTTSGNYSVVFVNDGGVSALEGASTVVGYSWLGFFIPITSGYSFNAGVEVVSTGVTHKAKYIGYNETTAGAVQSWIATIGLSKEAPYGTIELQEQNMMGVSGRLNSLAGWVTTDHTLAPTPIIGAVSARAGVAGALYSIAAGGSYVSDVVGGLPLIPTYGGSDNNERVYDHVYSLPEIIKLSDTEEIALVRQVTISSMTKTTSASYAIRWPGPGRLFLGSTTPGYYDAGSTFISTASIGVSYKDPDDMLMNVYNEFGIKLTHEDNAICHATVPGTPHRIWDVVSDREILGIEGYYNNQELQDGSGASVSSNPADHRYMLIMDDARWGVARVQAHTGVGWKTATCGATAFARDYIYSDRTNQVFVWIESEIVSVTTNELVSPITGSSSLVIRACVHFNGSTHSTTLYSESRAIPCPLSRTTPWGIGFGTSGLSFWWTEPGRPSPIYAPKWQDQGMCPHIAYTVTGEGPDGEPVAPRMALHMRTQLTMTKRSVDQPDPPSLPDVFTFQPFMVEQALREFGFATLAIFNALEAAPTIISFSTPDAALFTNVGAPNGSTSLAHFYRT